ncbi:YrdB family protein [Mumia zhuanghuii]|uniref:DUF2568 domain-containing protein n=1 Tax=Mumia zhuanghuii TaxID=2585211 RepID=A0A5C4MHU3_9ACTN|nr:YrdB family protein [Mumia zhuanghuii]TNC33246.1 DUF2568 domain-containing protein [Mumia zhuanghuii]TNC44196.1 DUF2568 domain-containing protein [Mumia zhuanghuii]
MSERRPAPEAERVGPLDVVAFACELAALVLIVLAGWRLGDGWWRGAVLAVALLALAVWFWGRLLAPRSPHRVAMPYRVWVKAGFYLVVGVLGALTGYPLWALALVAVAVTTSAWRRD